MGLEGTEEAAPTCRLPGAVWYPVNQLAGAGQERQLPGGLSLGHSPPPNLHPPLQTQGQSPRVPFKKKVSSSLIHV